jgi:hypothetical protein
VKKERVRFERKAAECLGKHSSAVADMAERLPYGDLRSQQQLSNSRKGRNLCRLARTLNGHMRNLTHISDGWSLDIILEILASPDRSEVGWPRSRSDTSKNISGQEGWLAPAL